MRFFIALAMLLAASAWGIGRSGNGTISSKETGFIANAPANFILSEELTGERLRLTAPVVEMKGNVPSRPFLEFGGVGQTLPVLLEAGREQARETLSSLGWRPKPHSDPCVDAYQRISEGGDHLIFLWGIGKGLGVIGPHSPYVRNGENEILRTLTLEPGACAW